MTANEIIKNKLLKTWPKSWRIFEDSCQYSIDNNLDFVVGILMFEEKEIPYQDKSSACEQLFSYLKELGYENMTQNSDSFCTEEGYKSGMGFTVFLSSSAIKAYMNEQDRYTEWIKGNKWGAEVKRPIYESIRYINIYKK